MPAPPASAWCTRSFRSRRTSRVAENVFLGAQPVNRFGIVAWRAWRAQASEHLKSLGLDIDPRARLGDFPIGVQQLVELARVLFSGARIIILDEPTSALSPPEIERLFEVLRRLQARAAAASSSSRTSSTTF